MLGIVLRVKYLHVRLQERLLSRQESCDRVDVPAGGARLVVLDVDLVVD